MDSLEPPQIIRWYNTDHVPSHEEEHEEGDKT